MRRPRVRVVLGRPDDQPGDLIIVPARRDSDVGPSVARVAAPRWRPPSGPDHPLAQAYRRALEVANERKARSLVLPGALVLGSWPMEDVTRVAMTVLMSTPSSVRDVTIAVPTPAMLEIWAEALIREP
jgi:hypothetical protein